MIGYSFCAVTLYEQMVVNNWYVIMEGFVTTTNWAARIYFILANIVRISLGIKVVSTLLGICFKIFVSYY